MLTADEAFFIIERCLQERDVVRIAIEKLAVIENRVEKEPGETVIEWLQLAGRWH